MTDNTQPEALRLADAIKASGQFTNLHTLDEASAELLRQHARIAELEAQLEAVGAGGVQALSAAPEAIAKLRHLYQNMVNGAVRDTASAKRIAEGLLAPAIEALERATPPAEQPQPHYSHLHDADAVHGKRLSVYSKPPAEQQAAPKAAPAGPWSLGEMTGNWRDIDLPDHGGIMRIVWKMEDDEGRNEKLEAQAHAVVAALNAASSTPPAEQQAITPETGNSVSAKGAAITSESGAVYAELPEPSRLGILKYNASEMRDFADRTHALRMQAAPKAAPGESSDWKPLKTSKEGRDAVRSFFREKLKRHDFDEYIMKSLAADFACVLGGYLRAAPQPAPLSDNAKDAARYRWLRNKSTVLHGTAWLGSATAYQRDVDFLRRDDALAALDAAIDAALAAQGGK